MTVKQVQYQAQQITDMYTNQLQNVHLMFRYFSLLRRQKYSFILQSNNVFNNLYTEEPDASKEKGVFF